jgi:uncharacterized membrane protein
MQADYLIKVVAHELRDSLERAFPEDAGFPGADGAWPGPDQPAAAAPATGYLQGVDQPGLIRLASEHDAVLTVLCRPGHFVIEGQRLVAVEGVSLSADLEKRIGRAFIIGGNRTANQDPEFGVLQLVEIAVRALSPGINDPFTAISCIDHLIGAFCRIARRAPREALRCDDGDAARLRIDRTDFVGLLDAAFNQIRQFATGTPSVSIRLMGALANIATVCERTDRREALGRHARLVLESCRESLVSEDAQALQSRYQEVERALAASAGCLASPSTAT